MGMLAAGIFATCAGRIMTKRIWGFNYSIAPMR
jgi:hypothetical protein